MTTTLTNDQITAGAAVLAIPTAILHLPCNRTMSHFATVHEMNSYKEGHRDARHAAADLVLARADELKALAAPSPQVADIAELPLPWRERFHAEGNCLPIQECMQQEIDALRDAIAASRRAAGGEARGAYEAWELADAERRKGEPLDETERAYVLKRWPDDRDTYNICPHYWPAFRAGYAAAPASAGQAAPALPESLKGVAVSVDVSTCDEDAGNRIFAELTGETGSDGTTLLAVETSRNFGAQPAEGAGQAGQVAWAAKEGERHARIYLVGKAAGLAERAAAPAELSAAARDVLAERRRQVEQEGWTPAHDDQYDGGELSLAASCYAVAGDGPHPPQFLAPRDWPWDYEWWKPTDDRRNLVKAGALILADIERLDRATHQRSAQEGGA